MNGNGFQKSYKQVDVKQLKFFSPLFITIVTITNKYKITNMRTLGH